MKSTGRALLDGALQKLAPGDRRDTPLNTLGVPRRGVVDDASGHPVYIDAPPYGFGAVVETSETVALEATADGYVMENSALRGVVGQDGSLVSLIHQGREVMSDRGNVLELYEDRPTAWDAWDVDPFHLETRREVGRATSHSVVMGGGLRAEIRFERPLSPRSTVIQTVRLDAGSGRIEFHTEVAWHESQRMLKVAFPVNVRAMNATYEMQFGCVERPTHFNTPYDLARFEVPGHRFSDLSEHGFGVAILSDSKYGYSTRDNVMRLSLLRAPSNPDDRADRGRHRFAYALYPHVGGWQDGGVVAEAQRFNHPVLWTAPPAVDGPFVTVRGGLLLDTVKRAESGDAIILRLYEPHGGRGTASISLSTAVASARLANLLEDDGEPLEVVDGAIRVAYTPYRIITIKVPTVV